MVLKLKRKLLYIILFIFLVSNVKAIYSQNQTFYFNFSSENDYLETYDWTNSGVDFTADNANFTPNDYLYQNGVKNILAGNDFTMCFDIDPHVAGGASQVLYDEHNSGSGGFALRVDTNALDIWYHGGAESDTIEEVTNYTFTTDVWSKLCLVLDNGSYLKVYKNGVLVWTRNTITIDSQSTNNVYFGRWSHTTSGYFHGQIDELCSWKRILNDSDIMIYNESGCLYSESPPSTPTLTLNTNLINNTINFNDDILSFTYNGSFSDNTKDIVNISFYINQIHNVTLLDINLSKNNVFNITIGVYSDTLNISFNASNFEVSAQKGKYIYNVDTIDPIIRSDFIDETLYYLNDDFNLYVNFTDDNLYAYNITFRNSDNNVIKNVFLDSIAVNFKENNTPMILDTEDNYTILIEVWDSHTDNKVKTKEIDYLINGIEYDNNIKIYSDEIKKTTTYLNSKQDRYFLDLEFNDNLNTHIIYIESTNYIKYLPISKYKGHFIIDFKYWVDFENVNDVDVLVNKINDNLYKITLNSVNKFNEVNFKSIGDLNYQSKSYSYSVVNINRLNNALLLSIDNTLSLIYGVVNMIPLILLYIALVGFSWILIKNNQVKGGIILWIMSIFMDFFLSGYIYDVTNAMDGSNFFITGVRVLHISLIAWIVAKVYVLVTLRFKRKAFM